MIRTADSYLMGSQYEGLVGLLSLAETVIEKMSVIANSRDFSFIIVQDYFLGF